MLYIGSDHAGFPMKEEIANFLKCNKISFKDVGTFNEKSCHYPDYAKKVCESIKTKDDIGILVCGTGIGMSMCANKYKHIRAALCINQKQAKMSRKHNNANVLCLQGRDMSKEKNFKIITTFLNTSFEGQRHELRINMYSDVL